MTNLNSMHGVYSWAINHYRLSQSNMANKVFVSDTVHGKKVNIGIFVSTPKHLVIRSGSGSTAWSER